MRKVRWSSSPSATKRKGCRDPSLAARTGLEHFGHATHLATLYLEGDLDKIALAQRLGKPQQTASNGNSLKFSFGALTIFQHDECRNRTTKLNTWRALLRMHLGEVSHSKNTIPR